MTAKEYLSQVQRMRTRVHRTEGHMEECYLVILEMKAIERLLSKSYRPQLDGLKAIISEQADEIRECREYITGAERFVQALPKATHRELLTLRYLQERTLSFEEIADVMGRSESWVRHLHVNALKAASCMTFSEIETA